MSALPEDVSKAWSDRKGPAILTTVDGHGNPNSIYVACMKKLDDDRFVIADNYFNKTRANILIGSRAAMLFITEGGRSFQLKGTVSYETEGVVYDDMKEWLDSKFPGRAATVLSVEEVFSGADRIL